MAGFDRFQVRGIYEKHEHLEVHSSRIAEAWLGEFQALLY